MNVQLLVHVGEQDRELVRQRQRERERRSERQREREREREGERERERELIFFVTCLVGGSNSKLLTVVFDLEK